jgi:hypothetical protein
MCDLKSIFASRAWKVALYLCSTLFILGGAMANPVFTGEASSDFNESGVVRFDDPGGIDVGMPPQFPAGTISGWDVKALYFYYNRSEDTMYVGLDFYGIAGDADGDGDPGHTGPILASLGGVDEPDLGGTESIVLLMDTNLDKKYELAVGVNATANVSSFGTYEFVGDDYAPAFCFGKRLSLDPATLYANPSASKPDIEFTIAPFSKLQGFSNSPSESFSFRTTLFAGSLVDFGIGDDLVPGPEGTIITFSSGDKSSNSNGYAAGNNTTAESGEKPGRVRI